MKKTVRSVISIVMIAAMLSTAVFAAGYESYADDLNALGLFKGTGTGYDLDVAPTRI